MKNAYKGYTIEVDHNLRFRVTGPDIDTEAPLIFKSADDARGEIDNLLKGAAKRKKVEMKVVDEDGSRYTVTGVNRHTGEFLLVPKRAKFDSWSTPTFYPDTPEVVELLQRRRELEKQLRPIDKELETLSIGGYRQRIHNAEDYPAFLDRLYETYQEKLKKATQPKTQKKGD